MNISKKSPISHIGNRPPVLRTKNKDGRIIEEKIPPAPYHRKMVTPSGNVVRSTLATGRSLGPNPAENPYGISKFAERMNRGYLLWAECPYAGTNAMYEQARENVNLAEGAKPKNVKPCRGTNPDHPGAFWSRHPVNDKAFVEQECCEHMEEIIAARQQAQAERMLEKEEAFKSTQARMVEAMYMEAQSRQQAQFAPQPRAEVPRGKSE